MRNSIIGLCLAVMAGLVLAICPIGRTQAHADMLATGLTGTLCVDVTSGKAVLGACNGGAGVNFFNVTTYGPQKYGTMCLQGTGSGSQLFLAACNNGNDQQWLIDNTGMYRNKGGWCANVSGGTARGGAQIIAFACNGQRNEVWLRGAKASSLPPAQAAALAKAAPSTVISPAGKIVGVISAGGGNIVAQGGGNIVAQGGGNFITPSAGAAGIVAQGGGN